MSHIDHQIPLSNFGYFYFIATKSFSHRIYIKMNLQYKVCNLLSMILIKNYRKQKGIFSSLSRNLQTD